MPAAAADATGATGAVAGRSRLPAGPVAPVAPVASARRRGIELPRRAVIALAYRAADRRPCRPRPAR